MSIIIMEAGEKMAEDKYKRFEKYQSYYDPVVVLDKNLFITFKNKSAMYALVKLSLKTNIRYMLNDENLKKLLDALQHKKICLLSLEIPPVMNRCVAVYDLPDGSNDGVMVLYFLESLNYANADTQNTFTEILNACRYESGALVTGMTSRNKNEDNGNVKPNTPLNVEKKYREYLRFVESDCKKALRLHRYLSYAAKISGNNVREPTILDVSEIMAILDKRIASYAAALGYKANFKEFNDIFIIKACADDFITVILALLSFSLKNSNDGFVNVSMNTKDFLPDAALLISCKIRESFFEPLKSHLESGLVQNLASNDYLDIKYAIVTADSNGLKVIPSLSADSEKTLTFKIMCKKPSDPTLISREYTSDIETICETQLLIFFSDLEPHEPYA